MRRTQKFLSIILAVMMVISIIPITASAATYSGTCGDNVTWTFDDSTGTLTISGTGAMNDYKINNRPWRDYANKIKEVVIEDGVTSIGKTAFYKYPNLTSVTISDSVITIGYFAFQYSTNLENLTLGNSITTIGYSAFEDCTSLKSVIIPNSVTTIEEHAFGDCTSLENLSLSNSVTTIGHSAFLYCTSLESVIIPNSVTTIGINAFYGCSLLKNITIPENVTTIGTSAFGYCLSLENIIVDSNNQYYSSDEYGVLFNKDKTTLILYPTGNTRASYTIPDSVISIYCDAFLVCTNLKNVTIPGSVTTIGDSAFARCDNITSVIIPESVTIIGRSAFYSCDLLSTVTIPDSVTTLGGYAFAYCENLTDVTFGTGITLLDEYVFIGCTSLTDIILPDGLTGFRLGTFANCENLKYITIPTSVTGIGYGSFDGCSTLKTIFYLGLEEDWSNIIIYEKNDPLLNATIHYNQMHTYNPVVTPPTCTEQGYTTYICECGESYVDDYVDALGHTPADAVEENYVVPTPTKNGSKDVVVYCSVCGVEISRETLVVKYDENRHFTGIKGDYFYKDDVRQKAYQLVEFEGDFYFINDSHKLAKNKTLYLSERFVNGFTFEDGTPLKVGYYEFDADGKMIIQNGVVGDYFYSNGVRLNAYQLVEYDGDFYFINDSHKVAKNKTLYLSDRFVNGFNYEDGTPLIAGYYTFDENGKMVMLNGPVGDYFYKDNVRLNAYQLVEFENNYYFINDSHKLAKNKRIYLSQRFVEGTDLKVGYYNFDADGKMIIE